MYLVLLLHVLGQGGVLSASTGAGNAAAWLLEAGAYCAVDCYALISGYVGYTNTSKPLFCKKFLRFWVPVFTYSFGITLVAFFLKPEWVGKRALFLSMLPIASRQYWYASAYAGLLFVMPWINKLLCACSEKEITRLALLLTSVFVVYVTFANAFADCFLLGGGYSFVWLVILYVIGAWMKKCAIPLRLKNSVLVLGMLGCLFLTWFIYVFTSHNFLLNYTSFPIFFIAFGLVALCAKLQFHATAKKVIHCFSPAAFGVYLIHVHPVIWQHFLSGAFSRIGSSPCGLLMLQVLLAAFCVFLSCLLLEKCRLTLFRFLKVDRLIESIADLLHHFFCELCAVLNI
jgi:hypothetical protein